MFQNYVVEIRKTKAGDFEHEVFWIFDEDATVCQNKTESKYHEIMSRAAVSDMAEHTAIAFTSQGHPLMYKMYPH